MANFYNSSKSTLSFSSSSSLVLSCDYNGSPLVNAHAAVETMVRNYSTYLSLPRNNSPITALLPSRCLFSQAITSLRTANNRSTRHGNFQVKEIRLYHCHRQHSFGTENNDSTSTTETVFHPPIRNAGRPPLAHCFYIHLTI